MDDHSAQGDDSRGQRIWTSPSSGPGDVDDESSGQRQQPWRVVEPLVNVKYRGSACQPEPAAEGGSLDQQ